MNPKQEKENGSPCAACKKQRKRCTDKCVLAPHFPQSDSSSFALVHTVFGTKKVCKLLQNLGEDERKDAVRSMVLEARIRMNNPVGGCTAVIESLQQKVADLETRLADAEFRLQMVNMLNVAAVSTDSLSSFSFMEEVDGDSQSEVTVEPLWTFK